MVDGKNNETNRFEVPYDPNLSDDLDQPSTPTELAASIRRHPATIDPDTNPASTELQETNAPAIKPHTETIGNSAAAPLRKVGQ